MWAVNHSKSLADTSEFLCDRNAGVDTKIKIFLPKKGEKSLVRLVTGDRESDKWFRLGRWKEALHLSTQHHNGK